MKLVVRAPLSGVNGYATLSRRIVLALSRHPEVELVSLQPLPWEPDNTVPDWFEPLLPLVNAPADPAECVLLQISLPIEFNDDRKYPYPVRGWKARVGYTMLETDRISLSWMHNCNSMDAILVPTSFNQETFRRSGVTVPVEVVSPSIKEPVPIAVVESLSSELESFAVKGSTKRFIFYSGGQWSPPQGQSRKGFEELLEAYFREFTAADAVGLVLRTTCTGGGSVNDRAIVGAKIEEARRLSGKAAADCAPILLVHGKISDDACETIWKYVDAFALPSHGEGWGLDFAAAASHGIPIVGVRWGGVTDFLDGSGGVVWAAHEMAPVCPEIAFYSRGAITADHQWAVASVSEVGKKLLEVYDHRVGYRAAAEAWRPKLLNWYSEKKTTAKLVEVLSKMGKEQDIPQEAACLVVQPMSLGDVFMVSAVVDGLRKKTKLPVDVMTKRSCSIVWEGNPNVRHILSYPDPFAIPLWRDRFDSLPGAVALRARYKEVYTPYHQTQIDFSQVPKWFAEKKHIVEVYAEACGLSPEEIGTPFVASRQPEEVVVKREYFGKKWVVIHTWTGAPNKRWSGFEELVHRVHGAGCAVIQVGGPDDPRVAEIDKFVGDLHEAAWCLNSDRAVAFIGVDSVMGHVAGALGTPTFSIFGGTTTSFSLPYWGKPVVFTPAVRACGESFGCHADVCRLQQPCIETITVDSVWNAVAPLLGGAAI